MKFISSLLLFAILLSSSEASKLSPLEVLSLLKEKCCEPVLIMEGSVVLLKKDIPGLKKLINDKTPVSAVLSPLSSFSCQGPQYISTLGREARHLLEGIEKKRYPLALCSTWDLKLEPRQ